jgi:hypothetical protein
MTDLREQLREKALRVVAGRDYHRFRAEREATAGAHGEPERIYEVALPPDVSSTYLDERVLPPFARYLKSRSLDPGEPSGVLVAVFLGEACYLLRGRDLLELYCEIESLGPAALHFRILRWTG